MGTPGSIVMRRREVPLALLLLLAPDVAPRGAAIVADFRAVYTPFDGFGGRVPTVWEVIHAVGLGGYTKNFH